MFKFITHSFKDPNIRRRIIYSIAMIAIIRLLTHIIVPGVDPHAVRKFDDTPFLSQLNIVSGSALTSFSLATLGLSPYISASIIMQVFQFTIPTIKEWSKQGKIGKHRITLLTRAFTAVFAITQTLTVIKMLEVFANVQNFHKATPFDRFTIIIGLVAGSMIISFIADKITERGIGTGTSIIIMLGIISGIPKMFTELYQDWFINTSNPIKNIPYAFMFFAILFILIIVATSFQQADYRIPVQHTNHTKKSSAFLPIKLNPSGVMPVVFASMALSIPQFLPTNPTTAELTRIFDVSHPIGMICYLILIIFFSVLYGLIQINPERTADSLGKSSAYLVGIRPGVQTQNYLTGLITKLALFGSIFLIAIAVTPTIMQNTFGVSPKLQLFGTSLLIMISTAIETINQLESLTLQNNYDPILPIVDTKKDLK